MVCGTDGQGHKALMLAAGTGFRYSRSHILVLWSYGLCLLTVSLLLATSKFVYCFDSMPPPAVFPVAACAAVVLGPSKWSLMMSSLLYPNRLRNNDLPISATSTKDVWNEVLGKRRSCILHDGTKLSRVQRSELQNDIISKLQGEEGIRNEDIASIV